jgi:hypothetical protein
MRSIIFVLLVLCSAVAQSANVTIDFEEYSGLVNTFQPVGIETPLANGYEVTGSSERVIWLNNEGPVGASISIHLEDAAVATFSNTLAPSFNFLGFEYYNGGLETLIISAEKLSGGTITKAVDVSGVSGNQWSVESDFSEFTDIISLSFEGASQSGFLFLDNIQTSVVPVPAAVWLFGSALAGLGWLRRKQIV